jgi:hypothetical protein
MSGWIVVESVHFVRVVVAAEERLAGGPSVTECPRGRGGLKSHNHRSRDSLRLPIDTPGPLQPNVEDGEENARLL